MKRVRTKSQLRCFCSRKPLLAVYGVDERGRVYVHCRVYKQNRVYGDWIVYGGETSILCRECLRWHVIKFTQGTATLEETTKPKEIDDDIESEEARIE